MPDCKGFPFPDALRYVSISVSGFYTLTTTLGNVLLILVILIDPHKQLRNRFNLWLINTAIAGIIIGGVVDPYRVYFNYLMVIGADINSTIPNRAALSQLCHMNLFCSQLVVLLCLYARLIDQTASTVYSVQLKPNTSLVVFGGVSTCIWVIGKNHS